MNKYNTAARCLQSHCGTHSRAFVLKIRTADYHGIMHANKFSLIIN